MAEAAPTTRQAGDDTVVGTGESGSVPRRRRVSPVVITAVAALAFAGAYAAFHRIGTRANANVVEFTQNLAGGFLALGMTEDQPGFIVLSELDQDRVEVDVVLKSNRLAGTHTIVKISTPNGNMRTRLRGPQVIFVDKNGIVEQLSVDWTTRDFNRLRDAADCSHEAALIKRRCGAPFTDLHEEFLGWSDDRVPNRLRTYLARHEDKRTRTKGED